LQLAAKPRQRTDSTGRELWNGPLMSQA
jgi:hypothetical protein